MKGAMILVDTNLLCRLAHHGHDDSHVARNAMRDLRQRGEQLAILPQNLYEFWSTATRPKGAPPSGSNGLGMSTPLVDKWLDFFQHRFTVLPDSERILPLWRDLVRAHRIVGHRCHDVRIVAAMQAHGVADLLTFNVRDFKQFSFLNILDPRTV